MQNEWPNGIGNSRIGSAVRFRIGISGWARRRRFLITRTERFTGSAGFTTIPAGKSRILACITSICCDGASVRMRANAVTAMGGKYAVKDNREIPDTLEALWQVRRTV